MGRMAGLRRIVSNRRDDGLESERADLQMYGGQNGIPLHEDAISAASEVAHVLFMDLVGYSRLCIEEQRQAANELRAVVRACPEFGRAERAGHLLRVDTGDGMALV